MNTTRLLGALFLIVALSASAQGGLIAAYNETKSNDGTYWPYSTGWLWVAPQDFELTRIETRFASGNQSVTIAVYDNLPQSGGQLLASAAYTEIAGTWGGADLGPVSLYAGEDYFVTFWNVAGLSANFTDDLGAQQFSSDGYIHYDDDSSPPAEFEESFQGQNAAIIRIYGQTQGIPEPASILVWSVLGGLGIAGAWRRRNRAA